MLDAAWAALMRDLKERGLLDTTLIVWMGEFGRTPRDQRQPGRPRPLAQRLDDGAGRRRHQGRPGDRRDRRRRHAAIEERPVTVPEFLATVCKALGIDPALENMSNIGRPIRLLEKTARPIGELIA